MVVFCIPSIHCFHIYKQAINSIGPQQILQFLYCNLLNTLASAEINCLKNGHFQVCRPYPHFSIISLCIHVYIAFNINSPTNSIPHFPTKAFDFLFVSHIWRQICHMYILSYNKQFHNIFRIAWKENKKITSGLVSLKVMHLHPYNFNHGYSPTCCASRNLSYIIPKIYGDCGWSRHFALLIKQSSFLKTLLKNKWGCQAKQGRVFYKAPVQLTSYWSLVQKHTPPLVERSSSLHFCSMHWRSIHIDEAQESS